MKCAKAKGIAYTPHIMKLTFCKRIHWKVTSHLLVENICQEVAPFILAGLEDSAGSALATIVKFWTQRDRDQHRQSVESCVTLPEWETRPRSVCYWFKPIIIRERVDTANLLSFHQIWIAGHCNPKTSGLKP